MVSVVVERERNLLAVRVSTLLPEVGLVPHAAVTPAGSGVVTARVTFPLNPPASVTLMVVELEPPWFTETVVGRAQDPETRDLRSRQIVDEVLPVGAAPSGHQIVAGDGANHTGWFAVLLLPEVMSWRSLP